MIVASANFGESYILELVALIFIGIFIVRKVVPFLRVLMNARLESIRSQLAAGDEAKAAAAELVAQRRAALAQAKDEAKLVFQQSETSAVQLREDGQRRAGAEYARIVARAESEILLEHAKVRAEVATQIGEVVAEVVVHVTEAELNEANHHRLIVEAIAATESEAAV